VGRHIARDMNSLGLVVLPDGGGAQSDGKKTRRLAARAVKGAHFAFIGAKRESLDRRGGRSRRRFSAGRA